MNDCFYLMESEEETLRLELKTDPEHVEQQARWAGVKQGMRVVDIGCGTGKTTYYIHKLTSPNGKTVGIDILEDRVRYALEHYKKDDNIDFFQRDIRKPLTDLGSFDFVWIRFVLEYFRLGGLDIVKNVCSILKPGGIICLIDLDHNCLCHFEMPERLEKSMFGLASALRKNANFDPYMGRKLYSYLYDLGFQEIEVNVEAHNLIYGELNKIDAFNWKKKLEVAASRSGYGFNEYKAGFVEFFDEFMQFFSSPKRFTYTPVIMCKGRKPHK
ncbi:MAG: methyltransferase domain-containing protein [Deltaproteobacteria bacterium]|nr:methyltransferase domain-containing protein [Deltaproteobacteria bacterium]MBW2151868.1 methyltransferase domain-containing protein [Deltaproteobacteria bacterium]